MNNLPPPNLQGDYQDSCVVCLRGCDTALAFVGDRDWMAEGLVHLGVPFDQAAAMIQDEKLATDVAAGVLYASGLRGMRKQGRHEGLPNPAGRVRAKLLASRKTLSKPRRSFWPRTR